MSITLILLVFLFLQLLVNLAVLSVLYKRKHDLDDIERYTKRKIDRILHTIETKGTSLLEIPTKFFHSEEFKAQDKAFYENLEKAYKTGIDEMVTSRTQGIDKKSEEILQEFRQTTREAQEHMLKKLTDERELAEKEIAEYKKRRIEMLDAEISEAVQDFSRSVLGKGIDGATHEQLIEDALREIKKQYNT